MTTSRPLPPPSDAAHERHDALLIAQLAAGDPLGPSELQEARRLVAACAACAQLAADLRSVASIVAWEPVPPRRRDFRIDAAKADRLRGSRWTRLLRRLSLPQSGALRPVAAGAMSLGLVLVVAGSVWPGREEVAVPAPAMAPQASGLADEADLPVATAPVGLASALPLERMSIDAPGEEPAAEGDESAPDRVEPASDGTNGRALDSTEGVAKASSGPARERDTSFEEAPALEEAPAAVVEAARGDGLPEDRDFQPQPAASPVRGTARDASVAGSAADTMAVEELEATVTADDAAEQARPTSAAITLEQRAGPETGVGPGPTADAEAAAAHEAGAFGIDSALVWAGVILAVGGAVVLVLAWLSRRAADPLLR